MMHPNPNQNIQPASAARSTRSSYLKKRATALALAVAATAGWLLVAGNRAVHAPVPVLRDADGQRQLTRHWFKKTVNPNHLKTWRRNKWKWYIKKRRQGRAYRYYKHRPGWTPHPNKGRTPDGKKDDDDDDDDANVQAAPEVDDAVVLEQCEVMFDELTSFVDSKGNLQCFEETDADHGWNDRCYDDCRVVSNKINDCVPAADARQAKEMEFNYLKFCSYCDCIEEGFLL